MMTILLIILIIVLLGGGGGYYAHGRYGGAGLGGVLGLVLIILIVLWLVGALTRHGRADALGNSFVSGRRASFTHRESAAHCWNGLVSSAIADEIEEHS